MGHFINLKGDVKMKKILYLAILSLIVFVLAACGNSGSENSGESGR